MSRTLAIDIECVPTTPEPRFSEPAGNWDTFAIALSFAPDTQTDPETVVLIRRSDTNHDLRKLLCAAANWIQDKRPIDTMIHFNGNRFDLPIIETHIDKLGDAELIAYVRSTFAIPDRDLFREIVDNQPDSVKYPSLDEALEARDIESATTRLDGDVITGSLMPAIGRRVLDPDASLGEHEERALRRYAKSDVAPLHELATALDREREQQIAAEAEATAGGTQ